MKKKIAKIVIGMLLVIIGISLFIISYYLIADIETKAPKEVEATCNLEIENYMGRKIFILTPKNELKTQKVILYFHGGAYVAEATSDHWKFVENLANSTRSNNYISRLSINTKIYI